jgi:hypothetical protein
MGEVDRAFVTMNCTHMKVAANDSYPLTRQNWSYGIDKSPPIKSVESSSRSRKYEAFDFVENNVPHGPLTLRALTG